MSPHAAVATALDYLSKLEAGMTVSEIAVYRTFVAVLHSRHLATNPELRHQWLEVLDTVGSFVDMIPSHGDPDKDVHTQDLVGKC